MKVTINNGRTKAKLRNKGALTEVTFTSGRFAGQKTHLATSKVRSVKKAVRTAKRKLSL